MTDNEILNFWGYNNLVRWLESTLRDVAVPLSSKRFLMEVGLPGKTDWTLRFDPEATLPRLADKSNFRRIGFDDMVAICLDEQHDGCVVAVEKEVGGTQRFINTTVQHFGVFLVLYQEYRKAARRMSEEEVVKFIPSIESRMRKTDPKAFDDPNNYWPLVIEQMNQGLL
jgi:hypothetical protein